MHEKFQRGGHKLSISHWGLGSIASGLHFFPKISLGCTPMHSDAPRPGQGVGYRVFIHFGCDFLRQAVDGIQQLVNSLSENEVHFWP